MILTKLNGITAMDCGIVDYNDFCNHELEYKRKAYIELSKIKDIDKSYLNLYPIIKLDNDKMHLYMEICVG